MGDTFLDMAADSPVPVLSGTHSNVNYCCPGQKVIASAQSGNLIVAAWTTGRCQCDELHIHQSDEHLLHVALLWWYHICDAIWENQPHGENLTFWVFEFWIHFSIYFCLAWT